MSPAFEVDPPLSPPPRRRSVGAGVAERWPFLLVLAAIALIALLLAALPQPRYRAQALILLPAGEAAPAFPHQALEALLDEEARRPSRPSLLAPLRRLVEDGLDGALGIRRTSAERQAAAVQALGVTGSLSTLPGGMLAALSVTAPDAASAVRIANRLADGVTRAGAASPTAPPAGGADVAARLAAARTAAEALSRLAATMPSQPPASAAEGEALALRLADARAAEAERAVRVEEAARLSPDRDSPLDTASLAVLRRARADLQMRRAGLATELGPRHPLVVELDQQLASAARQMEGEIARIRQAAESERAVAAARVAALSKEAEALGAAHSGAIAAAAERLAAEIEGARTALSAPRRGATASEGPRLAAPAVAATAEGRGLPAWLLGGLVGLALGIGLSSLAAAARMVAPAGRLL